MNVTIDMDMYASLSMDEDAIVDLTYCVFIGDGDTPVLDTSKTFAEAVQEMVTMNTIPGGTATPAHKAALVAAFKAMRKTLKAKIRMVEEMPEWSREQLGYKDIAA